MLYFLETTGKIVEAYGAPSPNPRLPQAAGGLNFCPQAPRVVTLIIWYSYFLVFGLRVPSYAIASDFLALLKLRPTNYIISYLSNS